MNIKVLGIDLGKTVCSLAGLDEVGAVVFRKRLQRHRLLEILHDLPPCVVAMEACGGSSPHWALLSASRPRTTFDVTAVCSALREGSQER